MFGVKSGMDRWVIEARDFWGKLIGRDSDVWRDGHTWQNAMEAEARERWPEAYSVNAYHWFDDRDDWEIFSPGE